MLIFVGSLGSWCPSPVVTGPGVGFTLSRSQGDIETHRTEKKIMYTKNFTDLRTIFKDHDMSSFWIVGGNQRESMHAWGDNHHIILMCNIAFICLFTQ